nr:hypothetical protein [Bryobacter sp.]
GFGGFVTDLQALQMQPSSQFLFDLATWNQGTDDLRGIDALAIVGDGGRPANGGDGLVTMPSASLYPFVDLARVRVVGHCHSDSFLTRFGCASSAPNIAKVDSTSHETFRIVRSFLTDTRDWLAIGTTVQTAPYLTNNFGLFLTQTNAQGQLLVPTTDWRATLQPTGGGAAVNLGTVRSSRVLGTPASAKTSYNLNLTVSGAAQSVPLNPAGVFGSMATPLRPRPAITGVQPIVPASQGKAVVSGAGIAISGAGFSQAGTEVLVNDAPVSSTALSDDALAATLPAAAAGGASLTVRNSAGTHRVNVVVQTPCTYTVSASPQQAPSGGGNGTVQVTTQAHCPWRATPTGSWLSTSGAASGLGSGTLAWTAAANSGAQRAAAILVNGKAAAITQPGSGAGPAPSLDAIVRNGASFEPGLGSGGYFSVFGANLAPAARIWEGRDFDGDKLPVQLDGTHVLVNGKAAYVYYISPTQINAIAPEDAATGAVSVQVVTSTGASNTVTAEKGPFSPALFLFDDRRYVIATYPDGSIVGTPNFPALRRPRAGDVITLWGTGFGPTAPMYPDGRIPVGAARTWNRVRVTIGGVEAQTDFAGLTGAGLYQFNVRIPAVSAGDQAVALEVGGTRTPGGMFLAVQ